MSFRTRIRVALITLAIALPLLFLLATGCKVIYDGVTSSISKSVKDDPSQSIKQARNRKVLVEELNCTPSRLHVDGVPIVIGECWVERRATSKPHYVWFEKYELLEGYWINVKVDEGKALFDEKDRLRFRIDTPSFQRSNAERLEGMPENQLTIMFGMNPPELPIQFDLIDRKEQQIIGTIVMTKK